MASNFHERFSGDEIKLPSERSTGLVFTAVAAIVAFLWRGSPAVLWTASAIGAALLALSLLFPAVLKPLNIIWFRFGLLLHKVVNPLIMLAIFVLVFLPTGLLMRLRYDPLRLRRPRALSTYWIDRKRGDTESSMTRQF